MMEYIKREIKTEKISPPEDYECIQVSINSWQHLVVRFFSTRNPNKDIVVVFDAIATEHIIDYIKNYLKGRI